MAYICLTVFIAFVVLALARTAVAPSASQNDDLKRPIFVAKRLTLRSSDPLTRRSPETHFLRFGRSGSGGSGDDVAGLSKINVKREAFDLAANSATAAEPQSNVAAAAAAAAARSSIRCVPDADSGAGIVCYTPSEIGERFTLVTAAEDVDADADSDEETDDESDGENGGDSKNETRPKRTEHGPTLDEMAKLRYGRSTSNADHDAFGRLVRGRNSFLRLGRAAERDRLLNGDGGNHLQSVEENANGDEDDVASIEDAKRNSPYIRFGRTASHDSSDKYPADYMQDSRKSNDDITNEDAEGGDPLMRYSRRYDSFLRLGRGSSAMNKLPFGTSDPDLVERATRRRGSFLRFGRSGTRGGDDNSDNSDNGDADTLSLPFTLLNTKNFQFGRSPKIFPLVHSSNDFLRFGRSKNFLRFGRSKNFLRFGRSKNFLRFGRSKNFLRFGRNKNFLRFGRSKNFLRFGRSKNFLRFGRSPDGQGYNAHVFDAPLRQDDFLRMERRDVGHSRTCDLIFAHLPPSILRQLLNDHHSNESIDTDSGLRTDSDSSSDSSSSSSSGDGGGGSDSISDSEYDSIVECIRRYSALGLLDVIYPTGPMLPTDLHFLRLDRSAQSSSPNTNEPLTRQSGWPRSNYRFYETPNSVHNVYRIPPTQVV